MVDEALNGWLRVYMFDSLPSAWLGYVGYHSLVLGGGVHAAVALLLLSSIGLAVVLRQPKPAVLGIGSVVVGAAAAALGAYPFGATRHCVWLLAFTVPALTWPAAWVASQPPRRAAAWTLVAGALLLAGGPVGDLVGAERAPRGASERVLRREDLTRMVDLLDPAAEPRVIVMSAETFYLLLPFYPREREDAVFTADGTMFHFPYGSRRILVTWEWLFTLGPDVRADTHLAGTLERMTAGFADFPLEEDEEGVLIVGAWHRALIRDLATLSGPEPVILRERFEPGLLAYLLDLGALQRAFSEGG
jgi:hypothetical protein